jgi:hypothetical protein
MLTAAAPITKDQELFYKALFDGSKDYIEIRLINDKKVQPLFLTFSELLHYPAPQDKNVYIGIFGRKAKGSGKIENCSNTRAIYLDFDGMELVEINYRIDNAGLPQPSMIVNSGHGYHVYWLLEQAAGQEVKPLIDKMAQLLEADTRATDLARILRIPDTMNLKGDPVKCELIELNSRRTSVQELESILKVKPQLTAADAKKSIQELAEVYFNGLHNMAAGVGKGERNFCVGRITQTLKKLNYTQQEAEKILFEWNTLNRPKKPANELKTEFKTFWYEAKYQYAGATFTDKRLQELNERFIDSQTRFFKGTESDTHNYDNHLLHPETFKKVSGLTFAVLSIIRLAESDGIGREHIAALCRRHDKDKNLNKSLKLLQEMGYIKVKKRGQKNLFVCSDKANYKRGYTAVGKSLHRSFIYGELKEQEYKLMILLENYAYDSKGEIYPGNVTLALRAGQSESTIKRNLTQLEHKQFIKRELKKGKRYIRIIYR